MAQFGTDKLGFFATTAKGMEELLVQELTGLGAEHVKAARAGVSFQGPLELAYRACLWSRVANRILLPLKSFAAPNPEKLYGGVRSIRWSDHLGPRQTLAVDFTTSHSQITHSHFGALKVKDAIVDQIRSVQGERPSVDPSQPDVRINVYLHEDQANVSIDLSGDSLHMRGYREESVAAPLKENLAAAMLLMAKWSPESGDLPGDFMDLMCGSGTLPIEAGLMAAKIAPGLGRRYWGFTGWLGHVPALWARLQAEAREVQIRDKKKLPRIVGYDRDFRAVRSALENVEKAGLTGVVHIEKREMETAERISEKGIVIVNPPYGERLGDIEELKLVYRRMGDVFKKNFQGWEGFILTGNSDLAKSVGLQASRRFVLYNGAIECRFLRYQLYAGSVAKKSPGLTTAPPAAAPALKRGFDSN